MKVVMVLILQVDIIALYPTWFRWKIEKAKQYEHLKDLYIPHGSDERDLTPPPESSLHYLYIPHGSDESLRRYPFL